MAAGYYRYPTIHAETIVFVSEDDLWTVPADGGNAHRLTANLGAVSWPRFSPDGSQLAFVSQDEGPHEIYVMPAPGGPARRLTYLGGTLCQTAGWLDEQRILFASDVEHWDTRFSSLYTVDSQSETKDNLRRLDIGMAGAIAFGPQGGVLLGRNMREPAHWKRYRGGTTGQLWIDPQGSGDFRPLNPVDGNITSPLWVGERIYFIADHEGIGNLYSCLPNGSNLRRHTDHERYYARNASSDGRRIVYHAGAELFLYDPDSEQCVQVAVEYHSTIPQRNRRFTSPARYLGDWCLHPSGESLAVTARGKLFSFANWEGAVRHYEADEMVVHSSAAQNGYEIGVASPRYRLPRWLNDGKRLIALTDVEGEESFVILSDDGSQPPQLLSGLNIGRPDAILVNPMEDAIVFSNHRYELLHLDLESRQLRLIDRGQAKPMRGFDWSPDGQWVAYSVSVSLQVRALKLWNVESGESTLLTHPILRDVFPAFDPRGRYLYFISYRTFDPVYDNLHFDLNFPRGTKPYLITLQKDLPSPFMLQPRLPTSDKEEPEEPEKQETPTEQAPVTTEASETTAKEPPAEAEPEETDERPRMKIDLDGIQDRIIAFPVPESRYSGIMATRDGRVLYARYPLESALDRTRSDTSDSGVLLTYNFAEQKEETLINGIGPFALSRDASTLVYRTGNRLRVLRAGEKPSSEERTPSRRSGWIDLNRIKLSVSPVAEWRQMFREAWRLQRDQFWTADMSQVDWLEVYARYQPLVERVGSRDEFSDLLLEMQGELGTSHAFEYGGDYRPPPYYVQGSLAADFEYDAERQAWRITHILHGDPWNPRADSPLRQLGVEIQPGDYLLAINGRQLNGSRSPAEALVLQAGEEVSLTVACAGPEDSPNARPSTDVHTVTVLALGNDSAVRYRQWVENNRQRVHAASNGRVGYVHIPDMRAFGYAEFHRGYLAEVDRQALIIDVRFNRGGNVSGLILEKLARRRIGYSVSRWSQIPEPYPEESPMGPLVALCNEFTASDGDIFSHGFKLLHLGPLVGKRTWGGVIGILPRHSLVDGTQTTQPEYSNWFTDVGWGVENYGTDPTIEVDITPQQYAQRIDAQLERGIQEALRLLEEHPPTMPDFSARPSRALPRLPKR